MSQPLFASAFAMKARRESRGSWRAISFAAPFAGRSQQRERQQIGGDELRVGRVVGEHEHLTGAGQKVNRDVPDEQALGSDDVGVAGAEDLLHRANGRGAE